MMNPFLQAAIRFITLMLISLMTIPVCYAYMKYILYVQGLLMELGAKPGEALLTSFWMNAVLVAVIMSLVVKYVINR